MDDALLELIQGSIGGDYVTFEPVDIKEVEQEDTQSPESPASRVVGPSPTELESANELIRCDHMYYKLIPEVNNEIPDCLSEVLETVIDESSVDMLDTLCDNSDCNDDISSLTSLDLVDFEQLVEFSGMSCLQQDNDDSCNAQSMTNTSCNSPFMQISDDTTISADTEVCSIPSPSSGYASLKSPFEDDITESFFSLADEVDSSFSWQESFTLFPSLTL